MNQSLGAVLAVTLLVAAPLSAAAEPALDCRLATRADEVRTVRELPPALHKLLRPMAEPGAPFNKTDVIEGNLPSRRLMRAGHRDHGWFVIYEQGGVAYSWRLLVAEVPGTGEVKVLVNKWIPVAWRNDRWTPQADICAMIDGAFSSRLPG